MILNNSEVGKWRVFVLGCRLFVECFGAIWPVLVLSSGLGIAAGWSQLHGAADTNSSLATTLVLTVVSAYLNTIVTLVCFNHLMQKHVTIGAVASRALEKLPILMVVLLITISLMVLGLLLFVIPGFILMVTLLPAATLFVIRPMGPIEAIRKSHNLVWGYWLRTANIYSLFSILVIALLIPLIALVFLVDIDGLALLDRANLMSALVSPWFSAGLSSLNLVLCHDLLIRQERQSLIEFAGSS